MKLRDMIRNIGWGLTHGLVMAVVLLFLLFFLSALVGSNMAAEHGLSWASASALFGTIGVTVGALIGVMRPLGRYRVGAMIMGVVGAAGVYFIGAIWLFGWTTVGQVWDVLLIVALFAGIPVGWYTHSKDGVQGRQ
ncbi:MAG: hypothetical protein RRA92_08070 [Gemmatimonadota bacterium]|nr:hypothetical protein [Gemmatimonadota bacterium]